jgi:hypothetical protein
MPSLIMRGETVEHLPSVLSYVQKLIWLGKGLHFRSSTWWTCHSTHARPQPGPSALVLNCYLVPALFKYCITRHPVSWDGKSFVLFFFLYISQLYL